MPKCKFIFVFPLIFLADTKLNYVCNLRSCFQGVLSGLRQFLASGSPLKMMKNAFYFTLKALFLHKIFKFSVNFWSRRKNGLIRKIRLTSKFMTSQPDVQTIAIHILPSISRGKGNQTMKFDQFIEYNKRNILLF